MVSFDSLVARLAEPDAAAAVCVLRHSVRHPIGEASIEAAFATALTEEGRELAVQLGGRLPAGRRYTLRHSPVPRCGDTARCIENGLRRRAIEARVLGEWDLLGGTFIRDAEAVTRAFAALGPRPFFRAWSAGELDESAIERLPAAASALVGALIAARDRETAATVALLVTHDLVIMTLLAHVCDVGAGVLEWPDYLDGVVLVPQDGHVDWAYRDRRFRSARP